MRWSSTGMRLEVLLATLVLMSCAPVAKTPPAASTPSPTPSAPALTPAPTGSPVPSVTPIPLPTTVQLSAPSREVVWVRVGDAGLFRSSDRGMSWTRANLPTALRVGQLSFVSAIEGWALVTASPGTQCMGQDSAIWHTLDAGLTWTDLGAVGIDFSQCKTALEFHDSNRGYVVADDPNSPPSVYRTVDGGRTWSRSRVPDPPGQTTAGNVSSLRVLSIHQVGASVYLSGVGWQHSYIYRSTNGGATWSFLAVIPSADPAPVVVRFIDALFWWGYGAGPPMVTRDGGLTWAAPPGTARFAAGVGPAYEFADDRVGYATVRGAIQRTVDGGVTWVTIGTPGT